jgi:hypothetical protein
MFISGYFTINFIICFDTTSGEINKLSISSNHNHFGSNKENLILIKLNFLINKATSSK